MTQSLDVNIFEDLCPINHEGNAIRVSGLRPLHRRIREPLLIIHDLGESVDHYEEFMKQAASQGIAVYAFDLRGHGSSQRDFPYITSLLDLARDSLQVAALVKKAESGVQPTFFAPGLASLVALQAHKLLRDWQSKVIFFAPLMDLETKRHRLRFQLVRFLSHLIPDFKAPPWVTPKFSHPPHLEFSQDALTTRLFEALVQPLQMRLRLSFIHQVIKASETFWKDLGKIPKNRWDMFLPSHDEVIDIAQCELEGSHVKSKIIKLPGKGHHLYLLSPESRTLIFESLLLQKNEETA